MLTAYRGSTGHIVLSIVLNVVVIFLTSMDKFIMFYMIVHACHVSCFPENKTVSYINFFSQSCARSYFQGMSYLSCTRSYFRRMSYFRGNMVVVALSTQMDYGDQIFQSVNPRALHTSLIVVTTYLSGNQPADFLMATPPFLLLFKVQRFRPN
uniref:Uncharacterized protein n=1 Tax=Pipistrellus kuhlii TaxID=59472 RepID=A0A7J8A7S1_PIPKU|nr:hypothetical protein mPipKuh1_008838 [Pipistrellus kuhlii]